MLVAVRLTDDLEAVAVLSEAINEGDDARSTGEGVAPLLERQIGSERPRMMRLLWWDYLIVRDATRVVRSVIRGVFSSKFSEPAKLVFVDDRDPLAVHALCLDQTAAVPAVERDDRHVEFLREVGERPLGRIVAGRCLRTARYESVSSEHHVDEPLVEAVPLCGRDPAFCVELLCDARRRESIPTKLMDPRHQFVVSLKLIELADWPTETCARFVTADPAHHQVDPLAVVVDGDRDALDQDSEDGLSI